MYSSTRVVFFLPITNPRRFGSTDVSSKFHFFDFLADLVSLRRVYNGFYFPTVNHIFFFFSSPMYLFKDETLKTLSSTRPSASEKPNQMEFTRKPSYRRIAGSP